MFWSKKTNESKPVKTIRLVKEIELQEKGYRTTYYTECNNLFVKNSLSLNKEEAENFYNRFIEAKGLSSVKEILRQDVV
jgi:hypothetical protein